MTNIFQYHLFSDRLIPEDVIEGHQGTPVDHGWRRFGTGCLNIWNKPWAFWIVHNFFRFFCKRRSKELFLVFSFILPVDILFVFCCCKIAVLTQPILRRSWSVIPMYCFHDKIPPPRSTVDWIKKSSPALEITPSACQQLSNALAWLALACINTRPVIHLCAIDHRLSTWACDICDGAVTR